MGDYRAIVKIEMDFGKTFITDMWINYSPDSECEGVDQRIIDWFRNAYEEGRAIIDSNIHKAQRKQRAVELEKHERSELKRLQEKYVTGGGQR